MAHSRSQSIPLGNILVKEGLVKKADIEKALSVQGKERALQELPIGQILIELGALKESQLEELLKSPELRMNLGTIAVKNGYIFQEQLNECIAKQQEGELIGQVLVREGLLPEEALEELLKTQLISPRLGELALKNKMISNSDLERALKLQRSPRKLGEILCDLGLLNPLDLNHVLNKHNKQIELGDHLLALDYISEEQLKLARQENQWGSESLSDILLRKNFITPEQLQKALSRQYNIPFQNLGGFVYTEEQKSILCKIISQRYSEKHLIIPISKEENKLVVALFKPDDLFRTLYDIKGMYSNYEVSCILITEEKFEELFEILYSRHLKAASNKGKEELGGGEAEIDFLNLDIEEGLEDTSEKKAQYGARDLEAEELVNFILKYGIVNGASDIHIEQDRKGVTLRYRLDGILREPRISWLNEKIQEKATAIISRIKVMCNLDIAEKRLPQDGGFRIHYHDKGAGEKVDLDFRVATCRATVGENMTIRILDPRKANVGLDNLSHAPHVLRPLKGLLRSSGGIILVCGPTGSGKSSTLYASLQYIYNPTLKIITAEDPVEYNFPGIMQTQINTKIDLTFSRLLRSFLRCDPDVILIGEIRDNETAKIGFDAAQTGHLLLSTLHTNDAVSSVPRLLDLGVEYGQIASSLMCVLAQRLVRKICPSCRQEVIPEEEEWGTLFKQYPSHLRFFQGVGCKACNYTGYLGRTLLSEIFVVDGEIAHALNRGYEEDKLRKLATESGMKSMIEDGMMKLEQTTLSEIIRMVPHEMMKSFRERQHVQEDIDELIQTMTGRKSDAKTSPAEPSAYLVTSPASDRAIIDLIQSSFEELRSHENGNMGSRVDPILFKEFIASSHARVCREYGCSRVSYKIYMNEATGRAEISAVPE